MGALERIAIPIASDVRESRTICLSPSENVRLRREYAVLKLVYEHLLELDPECVGETHEKVMGHRAWRDYPFHAYGDGLSLARTDYYRYAVWPVGLGEYECVCPRLYLAIGYAEHL